MEEAQSKEYETVTYTTISKDVTDVVKWEDLPTKLNQEISVGSMNSKSVPAASEVRVTSSMIDVLSTVTTKGMQDAQKVGILGKQ